MIARRRPLGVAIALSQIVAFTATSSALAADPAGPFTYHEVNVLGTSLDLHVAALTQGDGDKAHAAVMAEVERLRKILSTYDAGTDLGQVNATRQPVKVSREVIDVLALYDRWLIASNGAFSGRIGALIAAWKNAATTGKMPDKSAIAALVAAEHNPLWKLDEAAGTVQRLSDQSINIDSLGKGFIVSRAAAAGMAATPGVKGVLLNIGGDITALGSSSRTAAQDWSVDVADPANPAENATALVSVKISNLSIATSGSAERGYTVGQTRLSHILDPRSGYPIDSAEAPGGKHNPLIASATVIARDNATANALATTLCVLSPADGIALIRENPGTDALIVAADGTQIRSDGFKKYETISAAAAAKGWPGGYQVSLTFQQNTTIRERPYMAFWVEDAKGQHVVTLGEWGNGRWINSLQRWWRFATQNQSLVRAVSRPTRQAGKYTLTWDGKDQSGNVVAPGVYRICIEAAYDHSGHSITSTTIVCGDKPTNATLGATQHVDSATLSYAPKAK